MTAAREMEGWAPWHPRCGFLDGFMSATWVSPELDDVARRVIEMNRDEGTTNRNGWRAVKVKMTVVP